jgi:hypothetical protein
MMPTEVYWLFDLVGDNMQRLLYESPFMEYDDQFFPKQFDFSLSPLIQWHGSSTGVESTAIGLIQPKQRESKAIAFHYIKKS